jgi:DNA topoisomerase-1
VQAASRLAVLPPPETGRQGTRELNAVIDDVARLLGNTRAVCRSSYIHPVVIDQYLAGSLPARWEAGPSRAAGGLDPPERRLLEILT